MVSNRYIKTVLSGTAIVAAAAIALALAPSRYPTAATIEDFTSLDVGDRVGLPSSLRPPSAGALLIFVSSTCSACQRNPAFFDVMVKWARSRAISPLLVGDSVGPSVLSERLPVQRVPMKPARLGALLVPTVALIDRSGMVTAAKIGAVDPGHEGLVADQFTRHAPEVALRLLGITSKQLASWRAKGPTLKVVDIREAHPAYRPTSEQRSSGALSIPISELSLRARYELDKPEPVIIDCLSVRALRCQAAMLDLREQGFADVRGLGYRPGNRSALSAIREIFHVRP